MLMWRARSDVICDIDTGNVNRRVAKALPMGTNNNRTTQHLLPLENDSPAKLYFKSTNGYGKVQCICSKMVNEKREFCLINGRFC